MTSDVLLRHTLVARPINNFLVSVWPLAFKNTRMSNNPRGEGGHQPSPGGVEGDLFPLVMVVVRGARLSPLSHLLEEHTLWCPNEGWQVIFFRISFTEGDFYATQILKIKLNRAPMYVFAWL